MSSTRRGTDAVDAMLEMYGFLREEINQSNRLQQRIVLGLATFVGLVFGLVFSGALAALEQQRPAAFELLIAAVLPIIGAAAGIWLVEQSRVMMAGNYLQLLEYKIHDRTGNVPMSWENWLRREPENLPDDAGAPGDGEWNDPQDVYDVAYRVGYLLFFTSLGLLSCLLYVSEIVLRDGVLSGPWSLLDVIKLLWPVFWVLMFLTVAVYARRVLFHSTQTMDGSVLAEWEGATFRRDRLLSEAFEDHSGTVESIEFEADTPVARFEELLERADDGGRSSGSREAK